MIDQPKRRSERLNRRKVTLLNKAYEISRFCEPPTKDEIRLSYPLPINLLSKDIEAQIKKKSTCDSNTV
ncbi:hypothetical protein CJF32_00010780 [Rutstroemia sp. NJR-2017a WRK4]|nr:hypothetical protein CJF32_00010780 [Rutstroemia sp. NJR-2017a WRK4]